MKYVIHSVQSRKWYVDRYLIPSMIKQGIDKEDITIMNDDKGIGNLEACIRRFEVLPDNNEGTWHLQDDIVICEDFKERSEEITAPIICGFSSVYDAEPFGLVTPDRMWYSFPCIYIPNKIAKEFVRWFRGYVAYSPKYSTYVKHNKFDDFLFKEFLMEKHPDLTVKNKAPNLVNHIDFLLGGSICNRIRQESRVVSRYWQNDRIITDVAEWIKENENARA